MKIKVTRKVGQIDETGLVTKTEKESLTPMQISAAEHYGAFVGAQSALRGDDEPDFDAALDLVGRHLRETVNEDSLLWEYVLHTTQAVWSAVHSGIVHPPNA